ncbi:MAG TPA: type II secretion system protein [Longimicrobiaceae bacterium]|nr:type II secretion system protein [Longimicrobiaceae bacterium]
MNNRGFTLVELVVALVISGFLAGVVFQLVRGQERFVSMQSAREEVQQNGRAALELISAELRAASREGIRTATADSIRFRVPRIWGLVCGDPAAAATPGPTTRAIVFPGLGLAAFRGSSVPDSVAIRDSTSTLPRRWRFASVTDATPSAGQGAAACAGLGPDAGRVQVRTLTGVPDSIPLHVGEPAYLFEVVKYDADDSNVPGKWVRRNADGGGAQPLAGPLAIEDDVPVFRFRYFDAAGAEVTPPITDPTTIAEVQVRVTTMSRSSKPLLEFSDSTRVRLRN